FLRRLVADHVLVEALPDFVRRGKLIAVSARGFAAGTLLADDVVAKLDALVADEYGRTRDELAHLMLAFATEGAVQQLVAGRFVGHSMTCIRYLLVDFT